MEKRIKEERIIEKGRKEELINYLKTQEIAIEYFLLLIPFLKIKYIIIKKATTENNTKHSRIPKKLPNAAP